MDYQHWLREAISRLQESESPRRDAEILLGHVTGKARTFILAFGETALTDTQREQLAQRPYGPGLGLVRQVRQLAGTEVTEERADEGEGDWLKAVEDALKAAQEKE